MEWGGGLESKTIMTVNVLLPWRSQTLPKVVTFIVIT